MTSLSYDKCLGCYAPLDDSSLYHPSCSQRLFQRKTPPELETTVQEVGQFAHEFLSRRLAVTGVQRKLSLELDKSDHGRLTIVGTLGGNYIMKPPSPDYDQMPEIEDLSMHMAEACGIKTARHGLLPMKDGALAYVTKRFDRRSQKKLAVEDMCQLSGLLTEQKYRSSHERVGKLIQTYSSVPGDDVLRFFEVVIYSFVIGNNDMHLKNFSLMTDDPDFIQMTPAYDMLAVRLLLTKNEDPEELALTLNGKKTKFTRADFMICGKTLRIPQKVVEMVLDKQINNKQAMFAWIERSFLTEDKRQALKSLIAQNLIRIAP